MDQTKKRTEGCNDQLVAALFDLLYRRAWLSVHDPRSKGLYAEFRDSAMLLAKELNSCELAEAPLEWRRRVCGIVQRLGAAVPVLADERMIPDSDVPEVCGLLARIEAAVRGCDVQLEK